MSLIHLGSIFFFLLTAGLLYGAERNRGKPVARLLAMGSLGSIIVGGVLFCMDVPEMGPLMDPWATQKDTAKKEKVHEEDDDDEGGEGSDVKTVQKGGKKFAAEGKINPEASKKAQIARECEGFPEMVQIPAGQGVVGADVANRFAGPAEKPQREVRIWPGFQISKYEISTFEFKCFMTATKRQARRCPGVAPIPDLLSKFDTRAAATCVSWDDAQAYVSWLSARSGSQFALPTAVQWEYAARAGEQPLLVSASTGRKRNAWNVHDMGGGVAELTNTCWQDKPRDGGLEDAEAQPEENPAECVAHIVKDGTDAEDGRFQQHWARRKLNAGKAVGGIGFRIIRVN